MNDEFEFFTDAATLAIFDPGRLRSRAESETDWWCRDFTGIEEVRTGAVAFIDLNGDGVYRARITSGELTADERDYAASAVRGLGAEIVSGRLYVGPGECIPGGPHELTEADVERGRLIALENGPYEVDVVGIDWFESPRWWSDDGAVPQDVPVDLVIILQPRSTPFTGLTSQPRIEFGSGEYLFDSPSRKVGPEPGMLLMTKVRRSRSNQLCLKECGPRSYSATLVDYSAVSWKDTIRFRVLSVDHNARQVVGEFVEKVTS